MTSVQTMFKRALTGARNVFYCTGRAGLLQQAYRPLRSMECARATRTLFAFTLALVSLIPACQKPRLEPPITLQSPYPQRELWAVAPFANESGVSLVDRYAVADTFTRQVQQINGVETVPVNRVLQAMRQLGMTSIESQLDAAVLMNVLNADAIIVGTVTAWDPYRPPVMGAAIEMYRNDNARRVAIDPINISRSTHGEPAVGELSPGPTAQAAGVFDANNHQTLHWLDEYAHGRVDPDSAYGRDIYLVNMEMYTQFVSFRLLNDLLEHERFRLMPTVVEATNDKDSR